MSTIVGIAWCARRCMPWEQSRRVMVYCGSRVGSKVPQSTQATIPGRVYHGSNSTCFWSRPTSNFSTFDFGGTASSFLHRDSGW